MSSMTRAAYARLVATIVLIAGCALAWRGVSRWQGARNSASSARSTPVAEREARRLESADFDIDPAETSVDAATAEVARALRQRIQVAPPGQPLDLWRPRMRELAHRVPMRMKGIWERDTTALESIAREEGAREYPDWSNLDDEKRRWAISLAERWKKYWIDVAVSSDVRVRWSTFGEWFDNPLPPPRKSLRNARRPLLPDLTSETLLHEVLLPARLRLSDEHQLERKVLIGFSYYWNEASDKWMAIATTVYQRWNGQADDVYIGAPP